MPQDLSPAHLTDAAEPFLKLVVTMPDGGRLEPEAAEGFRIMELIRAHGVPIKAECGGAGVCATCHVRIPQAWRHLLPPPSEEELAKRFNDLSSLKLPPREQLENRALIARAERIYAALRGDRRQYVLDLIRRFSTAIEDQRHRDIGAERKALSDALDDLERSPFDDS